ncbi:very short patch repair endonuclease [Lachnotalea glycerini]|uniref:Very short patch repair endonuclease n=1 Tax=Lachnotalea glycerini TaxID=1763509 RepID=A0A371J491_9FIRM|nr:very short patch repair endonuclease [Lachnotalea glycerini]RDY27486.1 DNA mismatch endonuclease Vsr [Lachnotalea glycerini]
MDVHSEKTRSFNMSQIKSKNTKPEEMVRKYLFKQGFRYRKNVKTLPGCPDIVLKKHSTVIFVNGCFWHVHEGCSLFKWPDSNKEFWERKLLGNRNRDRENIEKLKKMNWNVIIVWECELKKKTREKRLLHLCQEILIKKDE